MSSEMVRIYSQCGMRLRSDVPLDLPDVGGTGWDVDVRWGEDTTESLMRPAGEVIAEYVDGENSWYTLTDTGSGFMLRFPECGDFVISGDMTQVTVRPNRSGRHELLPILLAGTASAVLLALRGSTVLHASAVDVDGFALAFVGQSGRGKSTIAALMCAGGAHLVTDDVLAVHTGPPVTCIGGATELRLRAAAAHLADSRPDLPSHTTADDRRAFAPTASASGSLPLAAIIIPSPSRTIEEIEFRRLAATDAMFAVMEFPRVHGWSRADILMREFATLSSIVNQIPVFEATIPWGPPFRPEIARELSKLATRQHMI